MADKPELTRFAPGLTIAVTPNTELVDPVTGELLEATPEEAGKLLERLRGFYGPLQAAIKECERVLVLESERIGSKTIHVGGSTYETYGGTETTWDIAWLQEELFEAGCPPERIEELVKQEITFKVSAAVAKQLSASNKIYADVIAAAKTVRETPPRVRVKA